MYVTGWKIKGDNDETGPNNAQHIVWAFGKFSFLFFLILTNVNEGANNECKAVMIEMATIIVPHTYYTPNTMTAALQ